MGRGGLYPEAELGFVFQTLRANDLMWPNVINGYVKGKSPDAFGLGKVLSQIRDMRRRCDHRMRERTHSREAPV